jgi:beta-lactamase regulating signal transducer with metallopeptidase domain
VSQDVPIDSIAAAGAIAWAAIVVLLTLRLVGGWILTRRLAARARPLRDDTLTRLARDAAIRVGLRQPFELRESPDVDAPVVLRWRRPLLLVPHAALLPRLGADQVSALLVHELAHVRRRDYLVNLFQSVIELPLFFSPAIVWLSRRVREAREFCCDDDAVAQCGDRARYVEALTALAALGAISAGRAAQGIAGPRLITRVRACSRRNPCHDSACSACPRLPLLSSRSSSAAFRSRQCRRRAARAAPRCRRRRAACRTGMHPIRTGQGSR